MFPKLILIFVGLFRLSNSVIYNLNDTEYIRMPPLYELDKYDPCLQYYNGLYCLTQIDLYAEQHNELIKLIKEYSEHTPKHYNHSKIERGICVTRTCQQYIGLRDLDRKEDLEHILAECVNEGLQKDYGLRGNISDFYCDKHNEESSKDIYDWLVLILLSVIVAVNTAGTLCDIIGQRQNHEKNHNYGIKYYLLSFSIIQNWNWLVSSEANDPRVRKLKGIHCMKTLIMYLFIIGHSFYIFHCFTENPHTFEKYYEKTFYKMMFNGLVSVQMLFAISGFLLYYYLLIQSEKQPITRKVLYKAVILRLWRLTPANTIYVIFSATWLRHWDSGPIWKKIVTDRMSGDCRKYWWSHLLFINNYFPGDKHCVVQNWQLAADFQLFVIGLCVFVATRHGNRKLALNALLLLGMAAMGLHIWLQDLDPLLMTTPETYRNFDHINYVVHKFSHVNLPSFVIGMLTAQHMYEWQKSKVDFSNYKKFLSLACHCVIPLISLHFYSGSIFYADHERASLSLRIIYGVLHRPVMAFLTVFTIIAMIMNFNDFWSRFLQWDGWVIPSRLTYSVSLIHTFFIIVLLGSRTQLLQITELNHTLVYIGVTVLSFLVAVPYCLLIEAPMNKLMKVIVSRGTEHRRKVE